MTCPEKLLIIQPKIERCIMDLEKLAAVAAAECVRQEATEIHDLTRLLRAYEVAVRMKNEADPRVGLLSMILVVSRIIDSKNESGYRMVPVTFQNGGSSSNWRNIHDHMIRLFKESEIWKREDAYIATRSFLLIHPFRDGNGRTAWILYNWLNGTLDDPVPLPDFGF